MKARRSACARLPRWEVVGLVLLVLLVVVIVLAYLVFVGWLAVTFVHAVRDGDTALAAVVGGVWVGLALAAALGSRRRS